MSQILMIKSYTHWLTKQKTNITYVLAACFPFPIAAPKYLYIKSNNTALDKKHTMKQN